MQVVAHSIVRARDANAQACLFHTRFRVRHALRYVGRPHFRTSVVRLIDRTCASGDDLHPHIRATAASWGATRLLLRRSGRRGAARHAALARSAERLRGVCRIRKMLRVGLDVLADAWSRRARRGSSSRRHGALGARAGGGSLASAVRVGSPDSPTRALSRASMRARARAQLDRQTRLFQLCVHSVLERRARCEACLLCTRALGQRTFGDCVLPAS